MYLWYSLLFSSGYNGSVWGCTPIKPASIVNGGYRTVPAAFLQRCCNNTCGDSTAARYHDLLIGSNIHPGRLKSSLHLVHRLHFEVILRFEEIRERYVQGTGHVS